MHETQRDPIGKENNGVKMQIKDHLYTTLDVRSERNLELAIVWSVRTVVRVCAISNDQKRQRRVREKPEILIGRGVKLQEGNCPLLLFSISLVCAAQDLFPHFLLFSL